MANSTKNEKLLQYWDKPVSNIVFRQPNIISEGQKERHRLFSLLAMAATHFFWNGDKKGKDGKYPLNVPVMSNSPKYLKGDYYGHNILALVVDFDGRVVDFEMNHNNIYNSSAEHAEARLVKRIFSLTAISDTWNFNAIPQDKNDYNTFMESSIYTTLESCSQCSGIMALAQVKEIVYLQTDNGMYLIGNILRNLTEGTKLQAPNPVDGSEFNFEYFSQLNEAFEKFTTNISDTNPFYIPNDPNQKPDASKSVTSFLCTNAAYEIYGNAKKEFFDYINKTKTLAFPDFKPIKQVKDKNGNNITVEAELSNKDLLNEISHYYEYIKINGRRGTPHK
jgi:tRNA(Arg) A34 adenosine deaminase TadA